MKEFFLIMKEEKICVVILHLKVHVSIAKKWGMSLQNAKCKKKKTTNNKSQANIASSNETSDIQLFIVALNIC